MRILSSSRRSTVALGIVAGLLLASMASAQETDGPEARPASTPESEAPENLISASFAPLIVVNTIGAEYERMIHPTLGGIAVRGRGDYVFLGSFEAFGVGMGVHYVYYLPFHFELDPTLHSGPPAGPFFGIGADVTYWSGEFDGFGGYSARLRGTSIEPNVYGGYRLIAEKLFLAPRVGVGWGFYGARYRDIGGEIQYYGRGHGLELHFDLVVGVAF